MVLPWYCFIKGVLVLVPERISSSPSIWTLDGTALLQLQLHPNTHTTERQQQNQIRPAPVPQYQNPVLLWTREIFCPSGSVTWALINETIDILLMVSYCPCFFFLPLKWCRRSENACVSTRRRFEITSDKTSPFQGRSIKNARFYIYISIWFNIDNWFIFVQSA